MGFNKAQANSILIEITKAQSKIYDINLTQTIVEINQDLKNFQGSVAVTRSGGGDDQNQGITIINLP